jgi:TRAP transporter 4TM/12TM fusion protein
MSVSGQQSETKNESEIISREQPGDAELISLRNLFIVGAIGLWAAVIEYAAPVSVIPFFEYEARAHFGIIFLGIVLELYILSEMMEMADGGRDHVVTDLKRIYSRNYRIHTPLLTIAAVIIFLTTVYLAVNFNRVAIDQAGYALQHEYVMAVAFSLSLIYLVWRAFGVTFAIVIIAGIAYGYLGPYMPGLLNHGGITAERLIRILAVGDGGFYGFLNQLMAAWIALFLLYAGFLKAYGAFNLILQLALRSSSYISSGVAQVAVIASTVIGSVNGSQTANTAMTGSFTIPMMKENGMKSETAAGVESTASTVGQILPPVMGAGAFIMASLVQGTTYVDVVIAGFVPAAVIVISILIAVHYASAPQLRGVDTSHLHDKRDPLSREEVVTEAVKYLVPFGVLVYLLGVIQSTIMTAALYTSAAMLATGILIPLLQSIIGIADETLGETLKQVVWQTINGAREGALVAAPVAIILASINGVVDILTTTGVPTLVSLALIDLSGGELAIAAVLAMIICIVLGMGMPVTASYTVVALLVAPTFINDFFLPDLAAHFFVFYAAILSSITPPIATTLPVAVAIAKSEFWTTAFEAIKMSAPLFVLPFAFVFHPEIVSAEFDVATGIIAVLAVVGAASISHGLNYEFTFSRPVVLGYRSAFFTGGAMTMIHPSRTLQYLGLLILIGLYVSQIVFGKPEPLKAIRSSKNTDGSPAPDSDPDETRLD